jgi:hypothetical protein
MFSKPSSSYDIQVCNLTGSCQYPSMFIRMYFAISKMVKYST